MKRLTREEFRDALKKGKGRAILHVMEHGAGNFRDEILHACTHDLAYDTQLEGRDSFYIGDLVDAAGDQSYYEEQIYELLKLPESESGRDETHMYYVLTEWAMRGSANARAFLEGQLNTSRLKDALFFANRFVEIDGMAGLRMAGTVIGEKLLNDPQANADWDAIMADNGECGLQMIKYLSTETDKISDAEFRDRFKKMAAESKLLGAFYAIWDQLQKLDKTQDKRRSKIETFADVVNLVNTKDMRKRLRLQGWGLNADSANIEKAYQLLIKADSMEERAILLGVFQMRPLPRLFPAIFDWACSDKRYLRQVALGTLCCVRDVSVRAFFDRLLEQMDINAFAQGALEMLIPNYRPGDYQIAERLLRQGGDDAYKHGIVKSVLKMADELEHPESTDALRLAYEVTPCAFCRWSVARRLHQLQALTPEMIEECRYDCQRDIREMMSEIDTTVDLD